MAAGDLTTLDAAKTWTKQTATQISDVLLASLISAASAQITNYCSRDFTLQQYTKNFRGNGRDTIVVSEYPVVSVQSVSWFATSLTHGDPIAGTTGFYFDEPNLVRLWGYKYPLQPVQIVWTAGYPVVPADVSQACNEIVGEAFSRMNRIGIASQSLGGQEVISYVTKAFNDNVRSALDHLRKVGPI